MFGVPDWGLSVQRFFGIVLVASFLASPCLRAEEAASVFKSDSQPTVTLALPEQRFKPQTRCYEKHCEMTRHDDLGILEWAFKSAGVFSHIETRGDGTEYRIELDLRHEFRDPSGKPILAAMLRDTQSEPGSAAYQRNFTAKFRVLRGAETVGEYAYQLATDANDPKYRGHVRARDQAVIYFVWQFIAEADRTLAFGEPLRGRASAAR
jgi:hypothetical protein